MLYRQLLWDDNGYGEPDPKCSHYDFDVQHPLCAYFYGPALSDGTIRQNERNSGALSIELKSTDAAPLLYFEEALPWRGRTTLRVRQSPFKLVEHTTIAYVSHAIDLRTQMIELGFPVGQKARTSVMPRVLPDERAFWRGYFDGDGSIGFTVKGIPFLSLATMSPAIANAYLDLLDGVIGRRPNINPNRRDGVWNIMVMRQAAEALARFLYSPSDLAIPRKAEAASRIVAGDWEADAPWRKKRAAAEP